MTLLPRRGLVRRTLLAGLAALAVLAGTSAEAADNAPGRLALDWATYNPLSILIKEKGWLEEAGAEVTWVQTLGSNKALEFLNAESIDFGSTAGAAALLGRINGNPIKSIYTYSQPEWTALVTTRDSPIQSVADLKGRSIAVTRGTDPHIFLVRALATAGLTQKDVKLVLLQHADGRLALENGSVEAWAGLDPMMAQSELASGARLFFRDPALNSWGILNVRESYAAANPQAVRLVIDTYEKARAHARADPEALARLLAAAARIEPEVAARQLERTGLESGRISEAQHDTILKAGLALQGEGVIPAEVDVKAATDALIDPSFTQGLD